MTTKSPGNEAGGEAATDDTSAITGSATRPEETRPLTVMVPTETLKRLKLLGILRDKSISDLVSEQIEALLRRDLKKALSKLEG